MSLSSQGKLYSPLKVNECICNINVSFEAVEDEYRAFAGRSSSTSVLERERDAEVRRS